MPINATVTAKTGPDRQLTAIVLSGMSRMIVDPDRKVLQFFKDTDAIPSKELDLTGVTTFTVSISGSTYTVTVS